MNQETVLHEYYQRQKEENKKLATHIRRDSKTGEILLYYTLKEVKYNDGTSRVRPQYLDCWGGYSFHSRGRDVDDKIIKQLEEIK